MERIVKLPGGGVAAFTGELVQDAWEMYERTFNGHRERSLRQVVEWVESPYPATLPQSWDDYLATLDPVERAKAEAVRDAELVERREKQGMRNARAAKTKCRWFIKAEGLNELLTLTYRDNQEDRALCKAHFKQWVRRMKAALGGQFRYVASFERQDRGAMHVHVACHKLPAHGTRKGVRIPAWRLGTEVWRSIIGPSKDGKEGGLCFVGGKTRNGGYRRNLTLAKLAAYVSKYILKDYLDSPKEANRYSRSDGLVCPRADRSTFYQASLAEMIALVFECSADEVIVSHHVSNDRFGSPQYWLVTEPKPARRA